MRICGIEFFAGSAADALAQTSAGGLVLAPSGPGLAGDFLAKPIYRAAVRGAELVLPDSGAMVLAWNLRHGFRAEQRLERLSGLKYLRALIENNAFRDHGATLWVMPSEEEAERNLVWLQNNGFAHLTRNDMYVAPMYREDENGVITDAELAGRCERLQPRFVVLNVGGGVQELLGWWLRENLSYRPAIICTGAAIAFLTGGQAAIPSWADRLYLGWLLRILRDPLKFGKRYWEARGIFPLVWKYGAEMPPIKGRLKLET